MASCRGCGRGFQAGEASADFQVAARMRRQRTMQGAKARNGVWSSVLNCRQRAWHPTLDWWGEHSKLALLPAGKLQPFKICGKSIGIRWGCRATFRISKKSRKACPADMLHRRDGCCLRSVEGMPRGRLHSARLPNLPARPNVYTFARDIAGRASAGLFWIDW